MKKIILVKGKNTAKIQHEELVSLLTILGYKIAETVTLRSSRKGYKLTEYKIEEIKNKAEETRAERIILEPNIPPSQQLKLVKAVKKDVIDRITVILEVFNEHAGSKEAKLQIELARLKHSLPILKELVNQTKKGEMPGFMAGGAYAIDKYYSHTRKKIAEIKRQLEKIREKREITRTKRKRLGLPTVALIGFANAGKTTIFNQLTGYKKPTGEKLFTTMTPKIARTSKTPQILLIDTVGFVTNVPPEIIEAFYSTLEEIRYADLLLFIIDITEDTETIEYRIKEASKTLANLDSLYKPVIIVFNKTDLASDKEITEKITKLQKHINKYLPNTITITKASGNTSEGLEELVDEIWRYLKSIQAYSESGTAPKEIKESLHIPHW